jgi:hypothetical protein
MRKLEEWLSRRPQLLAFLLKYLDTLGIFDQVRRFVAERREKIPKNTKVEGSASGFGSFPTELPTHLRDVSLKLMETKTVANKGLSAPRTFVLISLKDSNFFLENLLSQILEIKSNTGILYGFFLAGEPDHIRQRIDLKLGRSSVKYVVVDGPSGDGLYVAWNQLLSVAPNTIEYISSWNVDDSRSPFFFERATSLLDEFRQFDVYFPNYLVTKRENTSWFQNLFGSSVISTGPVTFETLANGNSTPHSAPVWRVKLHELHGLFDTRFRVVGDRDFWIRVARAGHLFYEDPLPTAVHLQREDSLSYNNPVARREWEKLLGQISAYGPFRGAS